MNALIGKKYRKIYSYNGFSVYRSGAVWLMLFKKWVAFSSLLWSFSDVSILKNEIQFFMPLLYAMYILF